MADLGHTRVYDLEVYKSALIKDILKANGGIDSNRISLSGTITGNMGHDSLNPNIEFSDTDGGQPVKLVYTDYDSYRPPAGLKVVGNQANCWFEVDGEIYAKHNKKVWHEGNLTPVTKDTEQTITGKKIFNTTVDIRGNAAGKHLISRNLIGSDGEGNQGDLYLQYGNSSTDIIHLGASDGAQITENGTKYSGNAFNVTGIVNVTHGGTGKDTAQSALANLIANSLNGTNPEDAELIACSNNEGTSCWNYSLLEFYNNFVKAKVITTKVNEAINADTVDKYHAADLSKATNLVNKGTGVQTSGSFYLTSSSYINYDNTEEAIVFNFV